MNDKTSSAASAGGEFLSFTLGDEHYGVDILKVQEIRGYDAVTRVPDAPDYIKGVINLRGTIVPVIDLRLKLRLDNARYDAFTVMIVLNVEDRVVGIVVDSVSDVIPLSAEQIRPTPEFGAAVDTRFISGIGTHDDRMLILLDIEMPEMDGLEFLRHARLKSKAKVVVLTSVAPIGSQRATQALTLGADVVITKPSGAVSYDLEEKRGTELRRAIYGLLGLEGEF